MSDERGSVVYLALPGPTGGGGGGGDRSVAPPRRVEAPGRDRVTVPVAEPPAERPTPAESEPLPQLTIAALPQQAGSVAMAGVIEAVSPSRPNSLGPGEGGGAGEGRGAGAGTGSGSGLDDGTGGNLDGGPYRAGNDVTAPHLLRSVRPHYTPDAMRARITGTVVLECVVDVSGHVERCRLRRSLDPRHGLDEEAVRAAYLWSFAPGTRRGQPVPVFVTIELSFSIQ